MSNRLQRINEIIKQELSLLIKFNLKDPRLNNDIISVTRVEATGDLRYAKVYVSIFEEGTKKQEAMEVLTKSAGFLRRQIGKKLTTHYTPELIFELDNSIEYGLHIDTLLKKLNNGEVDKNDE